MDINKKKKLTASLSILSNIILTLLKFLAGVVSGSISIISEAIHSISDFMASVITFFSVIKSSEPADNDHPYGHGKYEDMAGFIEGILIVAIALIIIYKSVQKIISGTLPEFESDLGIAVMLLAVVMNFIVSTLLIKVSKESNSISLYADGEHLRADVYSSLGVLIGLVLIKITGYNILDPIIAIFVAIIIYRTGYTISKHAWQNLLDHSLSNEDMDKIKNIVMKYSGSLNITNLKARQTGPTADIDLVLRFPSETTICECHKICDDIENSIKEIYINSSISIHAEPNCYKKNCKDDCTKNL